MEKFVFNIAISKDLEKQKEELCKQLVLEKHIQSFLNENKLPESFVLENAYLLKDALQRIKKCDDCQGLAYCTQDVQGHLLQVVVQNGQAEKVLLPCRYMHRLATAIEHKKNIVMNHMSEEQMQYRIDQLDLSHENPSYVRIAVSIKKDLQEKQAKGFFICGEPGVGKTYLTCCYTNEVARQGTKVAFVHTPTLIADLKTMMYDHNAFKRTIQTLKRVPVLILDDIGGESASTWSRDDILLPLLNERMEKRLKTLFTSNCNFKQIEEFYCLKSKLINDKVGAKRLVERMKSLAEEKELKGSNRRVENSSN